MDGKEQIDVEEFLAKRKEEQRKALKEKLKNEEKTIRDRKLLGLNNEPFPEGTFKVLQSNMVWEKVMGYLTNPSDVTSAYFACTTFAVILKERRERIMLAKVLVVLRNNADKPSKLRDCQIWATRRARLETWKEICLNFRQVCKAWKEIADFEVFDSSLVNDNWFLKTAWTWMETENPRTKECMFWNEDDIDRATFLLRNNQSSSWMIRNLSVVLLDAVVIKEQFFPKVIKFLEMYGASVWFFNFQYDKTTNMVDLYEVLCDMLELLPNLKGLGLSLDISGRWIAYETFGFHEFRQRLNERPFPILNYLEHFNSSGSETDETLLSHIFRKCKNLRSVSYSEEQIITQEMNEALKELPLERYSGCGKIVMSMSNQLTWPLKHLTIQLDTQVLKASELFPAIHHFRDTLQHLCICQMVQMDKANRERLDLPRLKSLHCIDNGAIAFDDLLLLQSLEEIIMDSLGYEDKNGRVKVKRYLKCKELRKSNVWQWFPNLKRLRLPGWFNFSRNNFTWYMRPV